MDQDADDAKGTAARRPLLRALPIAVVALAMIAVFATGAHSYLSLDALIAYRERLQDFVAAHRVQAIAAFAAVYVAAATLSIPGAVFLTLLGGFLFGWLTGGIVSVLAATLGAIGIFLVARTSFGDMLLRRAGPRLKGLAEGFRRDAFAYLLFLRFVPLVPFWMTNLAAALFGVRLRTYALATLIGIVPATFAFATAGAGLDSVIAAQHAAVEACRASGGAPCRFDLSLSTILTPKIMAALAALGLVSLMPVLLKRWRAAKGFSAGTLDAKRKAS